MIVKRRHEESRYKRSRGKLGRETRVENVPTINLLLIDGLNCIAFRITFGIPVAQLWHFSRREWIREVCSSRDGASE